MKQISFLKSGKIYKKVKAEKHCYFSALYPDPGSNRDGSPHWCLRPARLPIPPSGLLRVQRYYFFLILQNFSLKNSFFLSFSPLISSHHAHISPPYHPSLQISHLTSTSQQSNLASPNITTPSFVIFTRELHPHTYLM